MPATFPRFQEERNFIVSRFRGPNNSNVDDNEPSTTRTLRTIIRPQKAANRVSDSYVICHSQRLSASLLRCSPSNMYSNERILRAILTISGNILLFRKFIYLFFFFLSNKRRNLRDGNYILFDKQRTIIVEYLI